MNESVLAAEIGITLRAAGMQATQMPLKLGSAVYRFDAAWQGSRTGVELVLLEEKSAGSVGALLRQVEGLVCSLDILESKRSLTIILVAAAVASEDESRLSRVARLILLDPVRISVEGDLRAYLRRELSILLPLEPFNRRSYGSDAMGTLAEQLGPQLTKRVAPVLNASRRGSEDVSRAMVDFVARSKGDSDEL